MPRTLLVAILFLAAAAAHAATPMVSAADQHSIAVHRDGTLRAWGDDSGGALGIGRALLALTPAQVSGLTGVIAVAAGGEHTLALKSDGTVWAWGRNGEGQLGDGTTTARSTPVQVAGLTNVVEIGAGGVYSIARKSDGTIWTWGANYVGQLGIPYDVVIQSLPGQVPLTGVVSLSAGIEHVLAVTNDGRAWAWGHNNFGQLGDGTTVAGIGRFAPTPVSGLTNVASVAAGFEHSLARRTDGTVWAWGNNTEGSLGDGTTTSRTTPVAVQGLGPAAAIAAGSHSAAVKGDGSLWMWGANGRGHINDTFQPHLSPVRIAIEGVVASISLAEVHSYAVRSDGSVWSWGENEHGELGDGTTERRTSPVRIEGLANVRQASAGGEHGAAVTNDGRVFTWGNDASGQIGRGTRVFRSSPVVPIGASGFVAVGAGARHSIALHQDGRVFAVGNAEFGQLGEDSRVSRATFAPVAGLSNVVQVSAGGFHNLARKSDGTVWAFGSEYQGRLGIGSNLRSSFTPVQVLNLTNVIGVSAGGGHSLAVRSDGTVWAWGENDYGQLGDGTRVEKYAPVQVAGLTNVVEVSAGAQHSLARRADGSVWAWGRNYYGNLGDDTEVDRLTPVRVLGLVNATAISAGDLISAALTSEGGVWTWGANYDGQLGEGTNFERHVPFRLSNVPGVRSISVGGSHILASRVDGTVLAWGRNDFGQVGDATLASRTTPVLVARENGAGSVAGNDWFLDLDPGVAKNIDRVPVFLVTTTAAGNDVTAQIQFRTGDVGSTGSVFVFALAPAERVVGAVSPKDRRLGAFEKGEKDSVGCVLAQLNASGQLQAVSASNLQAYVSGVLSGQGQAVSVLNGVSSANIGGATFYVGYGSNPSAMLNTGTNRSVVSVPAANQCQPQPPQTGWWWNTAEGGRGYSIEVAGNHIFFASYLYDVSGRATWLVASGNTSLDGSLFTGQLESYAQGQSLAGNYRPPSPVVYAGPITLAFSEASRGTLVWPGGSLAIERFPIVANGTDLPPRDNQPESGWWWNPAESGRGYFLEWQGGQLFVAGYMYDDAGNPIWYLTQDVTPDSSLQSFSGNWWQFANGPALTGPFRQASRVNDNVAPVTIQFSGPETGIMTLPGGRTTAIRRFRF